MSNEKTIIVIPNIEEFELMLYSYKNITTKVINNSTHISIKTDVSTAIEILHAVKTFPISVCPLKSTPS